MRRHPYRQRLHSSALTLALLGLVNFGATASVAMAHTQTAPHDHDHDHDHDHNHDHDHDHGHDHGPGRHVHGEITVNLVLEGSQLSAEIDSPAIHVVGFERAAQNDAERARVATAHAWLASGQRFLGVPRAAACRPASQDFSPPPADAKHANYRARHAYQCDNPAALGWVELWALQQLEGVEKVVLNLIIDGRQEQVVLDGSLQRIPLR
jgi:hypothetical protein